MKKSFLFVAAMCALLVSASADVKVKTRNSMAGQGMESTIYVKGARQRSEMNTPMGPQIVTIIQCDLKRMVQVNLGANTCMITPLEEDETAAPAAAAAKPGKARKGGVITFTTTATDTGERKQMFGHTARRIKSTMAAEASPDACEKAKTRMEMDGWYTDLPGVQIGCATGGRAEVRGMPQRSECQDQMRFRQSGTGKLGFALSVKTTLHGPDGRPMSFTQETVDLSSATLDAALFEMPKGCKQVNSFQELMMGGGGMPNMDEMMRRAREAAGRQGAQQDEDEDTPEDATAAAQAMAAQIMRNRATASGQLRVGLVRFNNRTQAQLALDDLRDSLQQEFQNMDVEAVPIDSTSPAEIADEAREKQVQFLVYTDVTAAKQAGGKIGGMLGRATGSAPKVEAAISYRVVPVGSTAAIVEMNATGSEQGSFEDAISPMLRTEAAEAMKAIRKHARR